MVIKIGFVGCGAISQTHINNLARIDNAKMLAFCDVILPRAAEAAKQFRAKAYPNYKEMLDHESLDAVYVCVPPYAHGFEIDIVERGIGLFVEKPVALTMDTARKIEASVTKARVLTSVGYMYRYWDITDVAKKLLEEKGPVGLVEGFYIVPWWFPKSEYDFVKAKGGGQVIEQTTHIFDLVRYLVGEVDRVYAELNTRLLSGYEVGGVRLDVEDVSIVTLGFKNGAVGVIASSCGSRKTFRKTGLTLVAKDVAVEYSITSKVLRIYDHDEIREIMPKVLDPYFEEDKVFVNAVATGAESEIRSTYSDGVKTLELTVAANEASRKKQVISIPATNISV